MTGSASSRDNERAPQLSSAAAPQSSYRWPNPHGPGADQAQVAVADAIGDPVPREARLAQALVELADTLVADFDVVELLTRLAYRCVDVLDVGAAGLMLAGADGEMRVMASSSEAMRVLELFEIQAEEGPCLDCYRTGKPVMVPDLAAGSSPWPRFGSE